MTDNSTQKMERKHYNHRIVRTISCLLIMTFIALIFTLDSFQNAYAIFPVWSFSYNLNDGGVQGAGIPTDPVTVSVTDPAATGSGTITVRITSSLDSVGFDLILNEGIPGTFTNTNLALMSDNAIATQGSRITITVFDTFFTTPDPSSVQTLGGPPILIVSESDTTGITPVFIETGPDTNLYSAQINFASTTNAASNTLAVTVGDIFTVADLGGGNFANGFIGPNPNVGKGAILAEVSGTVTATYQGDFSSVTIGANPGPGRGSGGPIKPGLVVDTPSGGSNCNNCQPPTLGLDKNLNRIVHEGFSYNNKPVNVDLFYTSYPLIEVDVGQENIAELKIFDDGGIDNIAHVGLAFGLGQGESFSQSKATIGLDRTFDGKEITSVYDPENVLDNIQITTSTIPCGFSISEQCLFVKIQHTFREELEFNMVSTNVWDSKRNGWQNYYNHGIEIKGDSLNPTKSKMVAFGEKEMRGLYELIQVDKKKHLWADEFGNLYENKGNDRYDRIYLFPKEIVYDELTQHGCDRNCNWFDKYKTHQEFLAKTTLDEILDGKTIQGEPSKKPFTYLFNPITRAEVPELQKSIIYEKLKAEKLTEKLYDNKNFR